MTRKSVCIVGSGPGGLASAKVLLQTGQFDVTVFEKRSRIGGIWALDESSKDGYLSPHTPTNLSRFQVAFSDLSWSSVDLANTNHEQQALSMFPSAWKVNRYLETYRQKHIPNSVIHLDTSVVSVARRSGSGQVWTVTTQDVSGAQSKHHFEYVIMASGFFAVPRPLKKVISKLPADPSSLPVKIIHSGQYRELEDLFPPATVAQGKDILIIGGSNSAGEAAGVIARQLSSSQFSGDKAIQQRYQGCRIVHVTPRALYALPPYLPTDEHSRTFVPLDFSFYNLAKRMPGPVVAAAGLASTFIRDLLHDGIQMNIGGDQSDLGAPALVPLGKDDEKRGTVQVTLAESYSEYVRSGLIKVIRGKVDRVEAQDASVSVEIVEEGQVEKLDNIGAIVYATGYTPIPALDMLDDETKWAVQYDNQSMRLPLILEDWQTSAPAVPELAFIGFYEGPYWGIMEMQARLTADRWLGKNPISQRTYEVPDDLLALRAAMQARRSDVPQYWLGDYAGYMEEMAVAMKLQRNDGVLQEREGAVLPARYLSTDDDRQEANRAMADFSDTWLACLKGKYVARAVFRALQGEWAISRRIESKNTSFPSGTLTGTAFFHPRFPTKDKSAQAFDLEYLYIETGVYRTTTGAEMNASRRYVYRYTEVEDKISVWFVKPDREYEVDYLFHNLQFSPPDVTETEGASIAAADHLCINDMYKTRYRLPMKGISLPSFWIEHSVHGPAKDYVSKTTYERRKPAV
ncbi:hypothetical protein AMS68_003204 [Peltaster fructicola]|uniref:DUF6314 domain-containing protein n=1 Tax=Peltaster fructicola TaxID=286661 RepID=A0A6H0XSE9_9PEZI|nr:hypothetical protein AMS68_003204 [Peltaster fructicola]